MKKARLVGILTANMLATNTPNRKNVLITPRHEAFEGTLLLLSVAAKIQGRLDWRASSGLNSVDARHHGYRRNGLR